MNILFLARRNIIHFWRINFVVVAGVAVAVSVLSGALLIGTSVKDSLRSLALQRLGMVDQVVTSGHFVRETFAKDLISFNEGSQVFDAAVPLIVLEGFVTHEESGGRASSVHVYGVDDRFWDFHGFSPEERGPERSQALISQGLAREFDAQVDHTLIVRVQMPSAIPISSLHGRRDNLGRSLRLDINQVLGPSELGEFSFQSQQGLARSVFVSLTRLQQELDQIGYVNTVLLGSSLSHRDDDVSSALNRLASAESAVRETLSLEDLGFRVRPLLNHRAIVVETETGLIGDDAVDTIVDVADELGFRIQPVMTYLANKIRVGDRVIPYSLVTAIDLETVTTIFQSETTFSGNLSPVVLNEWAAEELDAQLGNTLVIEYYVWEDEGRLSTRQASFQVADIVPIEGAASDRELAPDYPGITEVNNLIEWDPPFDIDLSLIQKRDEDYWDEYRTTPKAFIPIVDGQALWETRWGRLTSMRLLPGDNVLDTGIEDFSSGFRETLDPLTSGFVVYPARALALEASKGATDFGLYFFYFSFFLVVSALLLASLFFRLGVEGRLREIGILRSVGFPQGAIRKVFLIEALLLSTMGGVFGMVGAVVYGELIMLGLRTWWFDAVGTTQLTLYISFFPLVGGAIAGAIASFGSIVWVLRSATRVSPFKLLSGVLPEVHSFFKLDDEKQFSGLMLVVIAGISMAVIGLIVVALSLLDLLDETAGFFAGGSLLLCATLISLWGWLMSRTRQHTSRSCSVIQLGFKNASYRPGRSVLCVALISSAVFIIVAVDAFRRGGVEVYNDVSSGTGGYTLLADSLLPIAHDLSMESGREFLNLQDLYEPNGILEGVKISRFKVRPGEDTSCLNLYQAKDPRILAPTQKFISEGRFNFGSTIETTSEETINPWLLLNKNFKDGAIPVIADGISLMYTLHLSVGDEFILNSNTNQPVRLRIVAALADSIFQRELLISEENFETLFPNYDGYRFFLIDAKPSRVAEVAVAFENRLVDHGFDAVSSEDLLASFHQVENTYLATFQTLGGLGLILGTFGLAAVLLRNVLERRRELALLRAVGYNSGHVALMVLVENALLLLTSIVVGTGCALVAIAPAWFGRDGGIQFLSLITLLFIVVATGFTTSLVATVAALRSPLLETLRTE